MIRSLGAALLFFPLCVHASTKPCDALKLKAASEPVEVGATVFCFVHARPQDEEAGSPPGPTAIAVYTSSHSAPAKLLYELPYSGTESTIEETFVVSGQGSSKQLIVIHSSDAPSTFDIAGRLYDVTVLNVSPRPSVDEKAGKFFGLGADLVDQNGSIFFQYPYKDREHVTTAINSPLYRVSDANSVPAEVKSKALLYPEPNSRQATKSYLIKGDLVFIVDATGGWCNVRYKGKSKTIVKWLQCDLLAPR